MVTVETPDGNGSGFAVREDGILATNQHVIAGHAAVRVSFADRNDADARVLQSFRDVDLAFLLVEKPLQQVLSLQDGEQLRVGQDVFAVGNPLSLGQTLTKGTISAVNRPIHGVPWLQTDTALNPGNSGGPLCDLNGHVVGMTTWRRKSDDPNIPVEGLNFALPVSIIKTKVSLSFPKEMHYSELSTVLSVGAQIRRVNTVKRVERIWLVMSKRMWKVLRNSLS